MHSEKDLNGLSKTVRDSHFRGLKPLKVFINPRLRESPARFVVPKKEVPYIEVARWHSILADEETLKNTLAHEYCHYKLYSQGKRWGHTQRFIKLAIKKGVV